MVDRRWAACRLLVAAVARPIPAAADPLWSQEELSSALAQERPVASAKEQAMVDRRWAACRLLVAAVARPIPAAADPLWSQEELSSALAQERPVVSAKEWAMVDRRQVACRLPMASQWAASGRETECLADLYFESESLLERPRAEAKVRAKRRCQHLQRRHQQ
jgi:hypothetical protein